MLQRLYSPRIAATLLMRAVALRDLRRYVRLLGDVEGHEFHGNQWTEHGSLSGHEAALQKRLVDFKLDRKLTGPDSQSISEAIPGAKAVPYVKVPGLDTLHEAMGVTPTVHTDPIEYQKSRNALFNKQPEQQVPFDRLTFTQPRVNTPQYEGLSKHPEYFEKPVQVIKSGSQYYLMNGHHRVVAAYAAGRSTVAAKVFDAGRHKALGEDAGHPFHGNQWIDGQGGVDPAAVVLAKTPHEEKLEQVHTLEKQLNADKVRITYPHSMDPNTTIGRQNIGIAHAAMHSTITARADMRAAGVNPPAVQLRFKQLRDRDEDFESRKQNTHTYATASGRSITINTKQPAWRSQEKIDAAMARDHAAGFHPTPKGSDIIVHETGHIMHAQALSKAGRDYLGLRSSTPAAVVASNVSRYARTNNLEFVAETFTGLVSGKTYPQATMDHYTHLGGPVVRSKK